MSTSSHAHTDWDSVVMGYFNIFPHSARVLHGMISESGSVIVFVVVFVSWPTNTFDTNTIWIRHDLSLSHICSMQYWNRWPKNAFKKKLCCNVLYRECRTINIFLSKNTSTKAMFLFELVQTEVGALIIYSGWDDIAHCSCSVLLGGESCRWMLEAKPNSTD